MGETVEFRVDRVGLLLEQLDSTIEFSRERLATTTDDEFLWEPSPGAWSIRPRAQARTSAAYGAGEWVLDLERPEPDPSPLPTIAWRIGHLHSGIAGRFEWTFGARAADPETLVDFAPSAQAALEGLWAALDRWRTAIDATPDHELERVGFGQYPHGLDPDVPFLAIVWWVNREVIHHLAEAALLRDLWRHRHQPA